MTKKLTRSKFFLALDSATKDLRGTQDTTVALSGWGLPITQVTEQVILLAVQNNPARALEVQGWAERAWEDYQTVV